MNGDSLSVLAAFLYSLSKIEEKENNMFDIENIRDLLENYLPDDMSFSDLTPDQLTGILANAGIDLSQLTPKELDGFFSSLRLDTSHNTGELKFGSYPSEIDSSYHPYIDAQNNAYISRDDYIHGNNKYVQK
ncbi:MAG: hypothetical protein ACXWT1_18335 [Methylobacter sp.]